MEKSNKEIPAHKGLTLNLCKNLVTTMKKNTSNSESLKIMGYSEKKNQNITSVCKVQRNDTYCNYKFNINI